MINRKRLVDIFIELVKIDSPSGNEEKMRDKVETELKKMGAKTSHDRFGNLYAAFDGTGKPFLLEMHLDTVQPGEGIIPVIKGDKITSRGKTVLGADDKAGIAETIEMLYVLKERRIAHRPLDLVFTREEEKGLTGATNISYKKIRAKEGFVIDNSGDPMSVCIAAPFITHIDAVFRGKTAHAGAEPEKGINAIAVAGSVIDKIKWGRIDSETTCNIGLIQGGTGRNVVPDKVEIKAETRSHSKNKMGKLNEKIKETFTMIAKKNGAKLDYLIEDACPGYKIDRTDPFLKKVEAVSKKLKMPTKFEKSGGATDANFIAGQGIKIVDISAGYHKMHTTDEYVKVSSMEKITEFLVEFLRTA